MTAIAQLEENRTVDGVYAVAKKERLRTRNGASYLALELVDPSGRISARVWNDVELLDTRFGEGDAVRVLGRVEKFRDRLQLDVRTLEPAEGVDPSAMAPAMRRDADELEGFLEFLVAEISHAGLNAAVERVLDAETRTSMRANWSSRSAVATRLEAGNVRPAPERVRNPFALILTVPRGCAVVPVSFASALIVPSA